MFIGADWLYTYLRTFYEDPSRPFGVNNIVFPSVGMPHVLEELQGIPTPIYDTHMVDGRKLRLLLVLKPRQFLVNWALVSMTTVRDLVNFPSLLGWPSTANATLWVGGVMAFLVIFTIIVIFWRKSIGVMCTNWPLLNTVLIPKLFNVQWSFRPPLFI